MLLHPAALDYVSDPMPRSVYILNVLCNWALILNLIPALVCTCLFVTFMLLFCTLIILLISYTWSDLGWAGWC